MTRQCPGAGLACSFVTCHCQPCHPPSVRTRLCKEGGAGEQEISQKERATVVGSGGAGPDPWLYPPGSRAEPPACGVCREKVTNKAPQGIHGTWLSFPSQLQGQTRSLLLPPAPPREQPPFRC